MNTMAVSKIIMHAGCSRRRPSDKHREAVLAELHKVAGSAKGMLEHEESAYMIAVKVVAMLEDSPLFNAGNGAALTSDGDHEVRA